MTSDSVLSSERLAEMLAGLEGVTPGPWHMYGEPEVGMPPEPFSGSIGKGDMEPVYRSRQNLAHIARCDPDTMRAILTELLSRRSIANTAGEVGECRYCANTGWFYGDPDLGATCGCAFGKLRDDLASPPSVVQVTGTNLLHAVLSMPHSITSAEITLRADPSKPGNATNQLHTALTAALTVSQEKE